MEINKSGTSEYTQQKKIISKYGKLFIPNQSVLTIINYTHKWAWSGSSVQ